MIDLDCFAAEHGLDLGDTSPAPAPESLPLTSAGARAQADLLHELAAARALIEMMEAHIRRAPTDDATFDALDSALAQRIALANVALDRLRDRRECKGEA